MTDSGDADFQALMLGAYSGEIRFFYSTAADNLGSGAPADNALVWSIDMRVPLPTEDPEMPNWQHLGSATAVEVTDCSEFRFLKEALEDTELDDLEFLSEFEGDGDGGAQWMKFFRRAADLTGLRNLLLIESIDILPAFRRSSRVMKDILSGLENGPAGRDAAMVACVPSDWWLFTDDENIEEDASAAEEALASHQYQAWLGSDVLIRLNAGTVYGELDELSSTARAFRGDLTAELFAPTALEEWSNPGDEADAATLRPYINIPLDLPPAPSFTERMHAPRQLDEIYTEPGSRRLALTADGASYIIEGRSDPKYYGDVAQFPIEFKQWLRRAQERYFEHWPRVEKEMLARLNEPEGTYTTTANGDVPHCRVPDLPIEEIPSTLAVTEIGDDEVSDRRTFAVTDRESDDVIGGFELYDGGRVKAFVTGKWAAKSADPEGDRKTLTRLGRRELFLAVKADTLLFGAAEAVLGMGTR